jgi:phosphoribosylpyrophosphate synthetase
MWLAETGGASIFLPAGCRLCKQLLTTIAWHHFVRITGCVFGVIRAAGLAKRLKFPPGGVVLLVRKRRRPDKHLLTSRGRRASVRGVFATHLGSQVDNRRVLLVDDVKTTGATLDACAKALREAGRSAGLVDGLPCHSRPAEETAEPR